MNLQPKLSKKIALMTALVMVLSLCLAGSVLAAAPTPVTLISTSPDKTTGVDPTISEIVLTFNVDVNILDVLPGQAGFTKLTEDGRTIDFTMEMRNGKEFVITPDEGFKANSKYSLTVKGGSVGYTSSAFPGMSISNTQPITLSFTTGSEAEPEQLELSVTPAEVDLEVGETETLTADATEGAVVSYSSDDEDVATVSAAGLITAVGEGETTITVTATLGEATKEVEVAVNVTAATTEPGEEIELTVEPAALTLYVGATGQTFKLTTTVDPEDAELTFASTNEAFVTVSEDGTLTAVAAGEATITVTASKDGFEDAEKAVQVTVAPVILGDVDLDGDWDIYDLQAAINIALGRTDNYSALQIEAADANKDGVVNISDVVIIRNFILEVE